MTASRVFTPFGELPRLGRVVLLLLGAAVVALSVRLWPDWRHNPDLSHGMFMPVVFLILLNEARRGAPRFVPCRIAGSVALAGLSLLGLTALLVAGLYAASVDWSHPLVNYVLTIATVLFLVAGLLVYSGENLRLIGFNWNALVAIGLWLLCAPIPPGTYTRLTLTLQLWVSESVLRTLHVLGIAAVRHGNIIELAQTTVGVEEACSGVRSLISCVFAGFFFSATLLRRPSSRTAVILLSAPLALLMNFIRSLTLTLLSNSGIDISGAWHDLTGFAVLVVTAALLAGLALALERRNTPAAPETHPAPLGRTPCAQLAVLGGSLGLAAVIVLFCVANTRPSARTDAPAPNLDALLPARAAGWQVSTSTDLYQFRDTLQTNRMAQRTYRRTSPDGQRVEVIIYAAYWYAGQAPVSLVASHTPDACWPGSGWAAETVAQPRVTLHVNDRDLPAAEYRLFKFSGFPQHVWFWHLYDGRPLRYRDPYSAVELLRIAWQYGFRNDGDQMFIRVSSNRPWQELARDPLFADFFARTKNVGL